MKKFAMTIATAGSSLLLFAERAFAGLSDPGPVGGLAGDTDIKGAISSLLVKVLDLVTIVGVVFVVVAGIRLIVSGGDEGEKDKAKKTIIYVIVGIVVVLFARVIVTFFANIA